MRVDSAVHYLMTELFSPVKNWWLACWLATLFFSVAAIGEAPGERSEAEQWFVEAETAWTEAAELDSAADEEDEEKEEEPAGEKPDFVGAFALFKKAAEAGNSEAALRISELLLAGYGIPKDTIGAFEWAVKSADLGNAEAQMLAASKYEEGRGTTKSLSKALSLYEKALAQGSLAARMKVAGLLDRGEPGVQQNRARALPLFQEAAKDGVAEAIYMVGLYLQRGYVIAKDDAAASQWFLRAAEMGEAKAQRKLAIRYFRGTGVGQNSTEALKWCELALKNPAGDVETKNLAGEYREAIVENMTPRKVTQGVRDAGRFEAEEFKQITLPPLPYRGAALVYHQLTDTAGNPLEAAILAVGGDSVRLERRGDGTRFTVPLRRLSDESRKLVEGFGK